MDTRKKIAAIAAAVLLLTAALPTLATQSTIPESQQPIAISADALIAEFMADAEKATAKYEGKALLVTGIIYDRASPKHNIPEKNASYITFGNWQIKGAYSVQCYFDDVVAFDLAGREATVRGQFRSLQHAGDLFTMIVLEKGQFITDGII